MNPHRWSARNAEEAIDPANVFVVIRARNGSKCSTRDLARNKKPPPNVVVIIAIEIFWQHLHIIWYYVTPMSFAITHQKQN
jgi:hypothetical protein